MKSSRFSFQKHQNAKRCLRDVSLLKRSLVGGVSLQKQNWFNVLVYFHFVLFIFLLEHTQFKTRHVSFRCHLGLSKHFESLLLFDSIQLSRRSFTSKISVNTTKIHNSFVHGSPSRDLYHESKWCLLDRRTWLSPCLTIRLWARDFYRVIVDEAEGRINYHA